MWRGRYSKGSDKLFVSFNNCTWMDTARNGTFTGHLQAPILIIRDSTLPSGGLHFDSCRVFADSARSSGLWLTTWPCPSHTCGAIDNVTGSIDIYNNTKLTKRCCQQPFSQGCTVDIGMTHPQSIGLTASCHGGPPPRPTAHRSTTTFPPEYEYQGP
jgi:hypothetical protein